MRKILIMLSALMIAAGAAFAQDVTDRAIVVDSQYWAGISTGYPFGVNLHFGAEDVIGGTIDIRGTGSLGFGGNFGIGADILADLAIDTNNAPIGVYVGGGLFFGASGNDFAAGLNGIIGAEYLLTDLDFPEGGVFLEVGPSIGFSPSTSVSVAAKLGFNYHF